MDDQTQVCEEWRPIFVQNEPSGYEVSDYGRVRSLHKGHEGKIIKGGEGPANPGTTARTVWLTDPLRSRSIRPRVDEMVAAAFLPKPTERGMRLAHVNGCIWDDRASNLKWESNDLPSDLLTPSPIPHALSTEQLRAQERDAWKAAEGAVKAAMAASRALGLAQGREEAQKGA